MDKDSSKAGHIEEENSTTKTRSSEVPKSSKWSSQTSKPRSKQPLPVSKLGPDVHRSSVTLVAAPSGVIRTGLKSNPESTIDQPEKEASKIDRSANRVSDSEKGSPANEYGSEASFPHADVEAQLLPDSKEGLDLNTLRSSVGKRSSLLSDQMKQICEDGIAFYEYVLSLRQGSLEGAEILRERWKELQPATDFYVNELLEIEDDRRKLAIRQDVLDHPEKHKPARTIADEHTQSEPKVEAKTSMTVALMSEIEFTADEVEARRELQNDLQNVRIWIDELYSANLELNNGLDGADLAKLELDNEQKERISDNNIRIDKLEKEMWSLELKLHRLTESMAAVRAAA